MWDGNREHGGGDDGSVGDDTGSGGDGSVGDDTGSGDDGSVGVDDGAGIMVVVVVMMVEMT